MPIRLIPPRAGKTPYWAGRGKHFGVYVSASTKARKRAQARKIIALWEDQIERGVFAIPGEPTFADAALAYMKAGGERTYIAKLLDHFGTTLLCQIDQAAIDAAAAILYPERPNSTRNRQVYTPMSAILKHAGITMAVARPAGAQGGHAAGWLWPEQLWALLEEAGRLDAEFRLMLIVLAFCGPRLSELLRLTCDQLRVAESFAYLSDTKESTPQSMHLPPFVVAELASHPRGVERPGQRVFRFHKSGHIYALLKAAAFKAGITLPERQAFHILRHTYATWMRRYGGLDQIGLLATDRWRDPKSIERYTHVVVSEEARRADLLPVPVKKEGAA